MSAHIARSRAEPEAWRYTDLQALLARSGMAKATVAVAQTALHAARLVFRNGAFDAKASHFGNVPSCILMGDAATGYTLMLGEQTCLVAQPLEVVFQADAQAANLSRAAPMSRTRRRGSGAAAIMRAIFC